LRYYEEQNLLTSTRSPGGQRRYAPDAVDRVIRIQGLFAAGLSSKTITELLPCIEAKPENRSTALLERLAVERERIDSQIADLVRARETLDDVITSASDAVKLKAGPPPSQPELARIAGA
jgi:DNA-binding transcriptional MerR regulator